MVILEVICGGIWRNMGNHVLKCMLEYVYRSQFDHTQTQLALSDHSDQSEFVICTLVVYIIMYALDVLRSPLFTFVRLKSGRTEADVKQLHRTRLQNYDSHTHR